MLALNRLMPAARELAVVLRDRLLVAGGNLGRVGVADCAAPAFIELVTQLQLQRVHTAEELLVHLLHQGGVPGKTARIQTTHFVYEGLQLLPRLGAILHCGPNLVEEIQTLVNIALGVGGVRTLLGRHCLTLDSCVSGVNVAVDRAIAISLAAGRIAVRAREAIAHRTRLESAPTLTCLLLAAAALAASLAALTRLAAALLSALSLLASLLACLPGLTRLPIAIELAGLELLPAGLPGAAILTLSGLRVGTSAQTRELVAQTGKIVHGAVNRGVLGRLLSAPYGASRVLDLLT